MEFKELYDDELIQIDGGATPLWWALMGAAVAVSSACNTVYDAGKNLGEFIYTVSH